MSEIFEIVGKTQLSDIKKSENDDRELKRC